MVVAEVEGVHSPVQGVRAHKVIARQPIAVGEKLVAVVDSELRSATRRHHTATHLLHAALRQVLGTHVKQAGSLVSPSYLRFDFSHFSSVADEELQEIEDIANRQVLINNRVETIEDVPIDVAVNEYHAMALFGEKYGEKVRVLKIADFSTELCGGTHVAATGEIGLIKILKEGSVSSGVRRIEAVAGEQSLHHFRHDHELEGMVSTLVGRSELTPAEALRQELDRREEELKKLRKELDQVRMKSAASAVATAEENVREVKGVKVLAHRADNLDRSQLRTLVDNFRNKIGCGVVIVGSVSEGKVAVIVGVTKDLTAKLQAGKIVGQVAQKVGGSGGGRPDMAEAGGKNPEALDRRSAKATPPSKPCSPSARGRSGVCCAYPPGARTTRSLKCSACNVVPRRGIPSARSVRPMNRRNRAANLRHFPFCLCQFHPVTDWVPGPSVHCCPAFIRPIIQALRNRVFVSRAFLGL